MAKERLPTTKGIQKETVHSKKVWASKTKGKPFKKEKKDRRSPGTYTRKKKTKERTTTKDKKKSPKKMGN